MSDEINEKDLPQVDQGDAAAVRDEGPSPNDAE
jgi:hypothetical protein